MAAVPASPPTPAPRRRRLSRSARIVLGLFLTFFGLLLLSILLPTDPGQFDRLLPIAAAGMTVLWVGGILMGIGSRS